MSQPHSLISDGKDLSRDRKFLPFLDVELLNCDNTAVTYIGSVKNLGLDSPFNLCIVISPNRWSKKIQISADDGKLQLELNLVAVVILALVQSSTYQYSRIVKHVICHGSGQLLGDVLFLLAVNSTYLPMFTRKVANYYSEWLSNCRILWNQHLQQRYYQIWA